MKKITRRQFLLTSMGATALAAFVPRLVFSQKTASGPLIGVARGDGSHLVRAAVDAVGGIGAFIKTGDRVCIKPNISFAANVDCGATTNPEIVRQVVQLCLDAGASKVRVLDHTIANAELCVAKSGIERAIIDKKVSLLTPTKERQFADIDVPRGTELQRIQVAKAVLSSDKLINLPTAKSHSATGVSLGMKSLMGLIWDRGYLHRRDLDAAIAELGTVIKPDLTIIDATRALTTGGPGGPGKTVILNTVVAGIDVVAVDSYTVGITQWYNRSFAGKNVKHIAAAANLGLGEIDTNKMNIKEAEA
jgi:uncharacterized protein (DUF362 family)